MVRKADELAKKHGWFLASQFENQANPEYHRNTTGPEILSDFAGKRLDFWVTGWGTGGTLTGAGEMIKKARPETKIIVSEPAAASLLSGAEFKPHKIQGWTPDFIPGVLNRTVADEILPVTDEEAIQTSRNLAAKEGIFCGISSGATFAAALKIANKAPNDSVILAMLPDTGERYLSTPLFEGIQDAVVFKRENALGHTQVWLRYVSGGKVTPEELKQWCAKELTPHQRPFRIEEVAEIGRMPNGKTNRRALAQEVPPKVSP